MKVFLLTQLFICASLLVFAQEKPYLGAEIRTKETFLYGKFEVRMKSSPGSGIVYGFFTFYDEPDFESKWNEIDIEILGRYTNEIQFNSITGNHQMHEKRYILPFNPHEEFHLYSFSWTPEYLAWSVDGKEVYRQTGGHVKNMNRPQKLMINVWASTSKEWSGIIDATKFPLRAEYDYVNIYKYEPKSIDTFLLHWTDKFDLYNTDFWESASHTFEENACVFDPQNVVVEAGYLKLALTKPIDDVEEKSIPLKLIKSAERIENKSKRYKDAVIVKINFYQPINRSFIKPDFYKLNRGTIVYHWLDIERTYLLLYVDGVSTDELRGIKLSFEPTVSEGEKYYQQITVK